MRTVRDMVPDTAALIATVQTQNNQFLNMMAEELRSARAEVAAIRREGNKPTGQETALLETFRAMNQMMQTQVQGLMAAQAEISKAQVTQMGTMMTDGMKILTSVIRDAGSTDKEDLLDRLPDMIGKLTSPLHFQQPPPPPLPQVPQMPRPQITATRPPAPPAEGAPPEQPASAPADEMQVYAAGIVTGIMRKLTIFVKARPDIDAAWNHVDPDIAMLPQEIREKLEALPLAAGPEAILPILAVPGLAPNILKDLIEAVQADPRRGEWLTNFWLVAPWRGEPEEEDADQG